MSVGLDFLGSLRTAEPKEFLTLTIDEDYFIGATEQKAFKAVSGHVKAYGVFPTPDALEDLKVALPPVEGPSAYYLDRVKARYLHRNLKRMLLDAGKLLGDDKPEEAAELVLQNIITTNVQMNQDKILDFARDGGNISLTEFHRKAAEGDDGALRFGWPTLDDMTGGLGGGDIITFVGRPGMGKTYMMLYGALSAWKAKAVPMFISMEMKPVPIVQRLSAMLTTIPITGLKDGFLTDVQQSKLAKGMGEAKQQDRPFYVVDGNLTATPEDILMMARQLRPDVVFIDAAYLLRNNNKFLGRWERVTENVEFIKGQIAEALNIPVVISYQINREGGKKSKNNQPTLEDIAYTDAIGQISSVVLGLFDHDNVETMHKRKVSILKGRNGETGEFSISWNFDDGPDFMDFSESASTTLDDLNYL